MKRILYTLIVSVLFLYSGVLENLMAQDFLVLTCQGDASVRKNNRGSYVKIKTGDKLSIKDKLKVSDNAYVGLLYISTNRSMELKKSGTYSVSSLAKEMKKKKKGFNERFAGYVLDEMTGSSDMFATGAGDDMSNLGSVERAIGGDESNEKVQELTGTDKKVSNLVTTVADKLTAKDNSIIIKLPRNTYLADESADFSWYPRQGVSTYELVIVNPLNKVVYTKKTHNNTVTVNFKDGDFRKGATYYWYVSDGKQSSTQYAVYWLSDQEMQNINNSLSSIDINDLNSLDRIMLAQYYEDKNIMMRAIDQYEKAIEASPEVNDFKKVYAKYLTRIGLYSEAKQMMDNASTN